MENIDKQINSLAQMMWAESDLLELIDEYIKEMYGANQILENLELLEPNPAI